MIVWDDLTEAESQFVAGRDSERERIIRIIERDIKEAEEQGNYLGGVWLNHLLPLITEGDAR